MIKKSETRQTSIDVQDLDQRRSSHNQTLVTDKSRQIKITTPKQSLFSPQLTKNGQIRKLTKAKQKSLGPQAPSILSNNSAQYTKQMQLQSAHLNSSGHNSQAPDSLSHSVAFGAPLPISSLNRKQSHNEKGKAEPFKTSTLASYMHRSRVPPVEMKK